MEGIMPKFNTIAGMIDYLAAERTGRTLSVRLAGVDLSSADVRVLFAVIRMARKYVALDLSACTGLTVWERYTDAGTDRVVSLALPDALTKIAAGERDTAAFGSFASLKTLRAKGVVTVGGYAFSGCGALAEVNLPQATSIGDGAFSDCTALAEANIQQVAGIGDCAFSGCTALAEINLSWATRVGSRAFSGCTALAKISLPLITIIGAYAFYDCYKLESLILGAEVPAYFGSEMFYAAGRDTEAGFTIFVPDEEAKGHLEAEIARSCNSGICILDAPFDYDSSSKFFGYDSPGKFREVTTLSHG
jgi:hypothetical protein